MNTYPGSASKNLLYSKGVRPSLIAIAVLALSAGANAQSFPPIPQGTAVYDGAGLLSPQDESAISNLAQAFMRDTGAPIIVATFPSLAQVGAQGVGIEAYSTALFNNWRIGRNDANGGILLVVARDDRKVRIELGKDWKNDYDAAARNVNQNVILPAFRRGDYSGGIRSGVDALAQMANGSAAPAPDTGGAPVGGPMATPYGPAPYGPTGGGFDFGSLL
ncbi:TPM domain-containing protein, partial [bacterium]